MLKPLCLLLTAAFISLNSIRNDILPITALPKDWIMNFIVMMITLAIMKNAKIAAKAIRQGELPMNLIGVVVSGLLAMAILAATAGQDTDTNKCF